MIVITSVANVKIVYNSCVILYDSPRKQLRENKTSVIFNPKRVTVPWLRSLVAGLSPRRPELAPGSIHVGFVVDRVALGHVFPRVLRFSPVNIIPPSVSKLISSGE
jgi:hypothetical protein